MAEAVRRILDKLDVACFVVPSEDPHDSEYPAEHFKRRSWISGFHGSAGTAIILRVGAPLLFVDPRYWIKAEVRSVLEPLDCGATIPGFFSSFLLTVLTVSHLCRRYQRLLAGVW